MEGEGEGSNAWRSMEGKGSISPFPTFPQTTLFKPLCFSFDIKILLYHGSRPLFTHFLLFPWPINYDHTF
jgi:hypothetical protein